MPDLKLEPLLEAAQPERLWPLLEPFFGSNAELPRLSGTRIQAPVCYWGVYRGAETRVTLKSFFTEDGYRRYAAQLQEHYPERIGQPGHPRGGLVLVPELNGVLWGFPFDPSMPGLFRCADGAWIAQVLRRRSSEPLGVQVRNYRPEIGAVLSYAEPTRGTTIAYGKIAPKATAGLIWVVMDRLWNSSARQEGRLRLARPLAYRPHAGLLLQAPVGGAPLKGSRNRKSFLELVETAAVALVAVHEADIPFGPRRGIEPMLARLEDRQEDLVFTAPRLHRTLRRLAHQLQARAGRGEPGPLVPSHGDYKWDQFLHWGGRFSLIDFELFCQAERAYDLGYFCAYLPPSKPEDWREGAAAELLRARFLETYARHAPDSVDPQRIALYEAAMLATRALSHVWRQGTHWQLRAGQLLDLAFERLLNPPSLVSADG